MNSSASPSVDLRQIDLNLLRVFDTIARERSLARAAQHLGLTQPGLSRALARLRNEFGDQLFVKVGAKLLLTPRAESAAGSIHEALGLVGQALLAQRSFEPAAASRVFTIMAPDYLEAILLGQLTTRVQSEAPGVSLQTMRLPASDSLATQSGRADLAISAQPLELPGVHARKLWSDRFVCVLRRGHPVLRKDELTLSDFLALKHVAVTPPDQGGCAIDAALASRGVRRQIAVRIQSFLAAPELIESSDWVAAVPEHLALRLTHGRPIAVRPLPFDVGALELHLSWHDRLHRDLGHAWLRQRVVDVATQSFGQPRPRKLAMVEVRAG